MWMSIIWWPYLTEKKKSYFFQIKQTKVLKEFKWRKYVYRSIQFSSVAQSSPTLCDPMNCSTPRLPVQHQLLEFTQTHVHRVSDAIQPSHPLSSPSPPAPNPSQHQSFPMSQLFASGGQSTGVSALASVLPKNIQDWSPQKLPKNNILNQYNIVK